MQNLGDDRPGTKPPDDIRLKTLQAACAAAQQVECRVCWTGPLEECVYTTGPVSVPVTPGTPVRPVRGYHADRLQRAADQGLITAADLEAVTGGLEPGAVVWDDGSAPRRAPAVAAHPYIPPGPVEAAPYQGYCQPEVRQQAFAAVLAGVQLGAYDTRMVNWLAGWDDPTCRTIASLMHRCRLAGTAHLVARLDGLRALLAAVLASEDRSRQVALEHAEAELADICANQPGDTGSITLTAAETSIVRQALADASAWRTWRTEGDRTADIEQATAYERLLRRLVTAQGGL